MNIVFGSYKELSDKRLVKWLEEAERGKHDDKIMSHAPIKPKGSQVFLYRCKGANDKDYLRDEYTGLISNGTNYKNKSDLDKHWYNLYVGDKTVKGFAKYVYWLRANRNKADKVVLIHYEGN